MKNNNDLADFLKDGTLALKLKPQEYCYYGEPGDNYWTRYEFEIVIRYWGDENRDDLVIGALVAEQFHANRADTDHFCSHCAFDTYPSGDINQYMDIMWDEENHELSKNFSKVTGFDHIAGNVFLLMSLNVHPKFRGHDLGNAAIWIFYRNFCNPFDWMIVLAYPLQFSIKEEDQQKCRRGEFPGTQKECTKRLTNYYEQLGFTRVGRSDFLFFSCEYEMAKPEILETLEY